MASFLVGAPTDASCSQGLPGRQEPAFIAANLKDFNQGSALNIAVITCVVSLSLQHSALTFFLSPFPATSSSSASTLPATLVPTPSPPVSQELPLLKPPEARLELLPMPGFVFLLRFFLSGLELTFLLDRTPRSESRPTLLLERRGLEIVRAFSAPLVHPVQRHS